MHVLLKAPEVLFVKINYIGINSIVLDDESDSDNILNKKFRFLHVIPCIYINKYKLRVNIVVDSIEMNSAHEHTMVALLIDSLQKDNNIILIGGKL